jgi:GT2 family glycosyltransferase
VPPAELVVVDGGTASTVDALDAFRAAVPACRTRHVRTAPGLPRQRNLGARVSDGDVVVYLDDDVVLEPGYLAALARVYAEDPAHAIGGVGGAQVPDPTPRESPWRRAACRLFLLDGYGRGIVKRSGRVEYAFAPARPLQVEFLSGCNMSFRREVLEALAFDERLGGYALGEDLQFSYRVSRRWRLVVTPDARCEHRHADGGRPRGDAFRAMAVFNKYLFVRDCVARRRLDWLAFAWAALGDAMLRVRAPRDRGFAGLLRGWALVWRHVRHGALPEA